MKKDKDLCKILEQWAEANFLNVLERKEQESIALDFLKTHCILEDR